MEPKTNQSSVQSGQGQEQKGQQVQRASSSQVAPRGRNIGALTFPSPMEFFQNPFGVMRRVHEDMDRVFAQTLGGMGMGMTGAGTGASGGGMMNWAPAIEVAQRGDNLVISAELPGLRPEDVQIEATDDAVILRGERRQEQQTNEAGIRRTERQYGQFYREIPLPEGASTDQAKAQFNNGVLEITIPVPQQQNQPRQIPIGTGSEQQQAAASGQSAKQTGGKVQG